MSETMIYGISGLLICFGIATFLLSRIPTGVYPEEYEYSLDPFWYIWGVMFAGGVAAYHFFPELPDMVKNYGYSDFIVPFLFAFVIYFCYLLDVGWLTNIITFGAALCISFMQPDELYLFDKYLEPWQDRIAIAALLFICSKGLSVLNGLGGIASLQFLTVMAATVILAHFGFLPQILAVVALTYAGAMLAFCLFSWPPEKLILNNGAFCSFGFIMGCFMLNGANEYAEASMFIAASYMATEFGIAFYNKIICRVPEEQWYAATSYYKISNDGAYERGVVIGTAKIFIVDLILCVIQMGAVERLAVPIFSVAVNIWVLSILSGDTKPEELLSISKWSTRKIKGALSKKKAAKKQDKGQ